MSLSGTQVCTDHTLSTIYKSIDKCYEAAEYVYTMKLPDAGAKIQKAYCIKLGDTK